MLVFHDLDFTANGIQLMADKTGTPQRLQSNTTVSRVALHRFTNGRSKSFTPRARATASLAFSKHPATEGRARAESTVTPRRKTGVVSYVAPHVLF